ncbi:GNAT family N-acetyltransferase [Nocardia callitridis]
MPNLLPDIVSADLFTKLAQPTLTAEDGLTLRPWVHGDAPAVRIAYQDPEIQAWHCRSIDTEEEAHQFIDRWRTGWREAAAAQWAVVDGEQVVGRVGFRYMAPAEGEAEVAYWTMPGHRGQRIAPRALTTLIAWAFDDIGFHRLALVHSVRNSASCRVAQATGFTLEGTQRSACAHTDGWHDMHLHALINPR